MLIDEEKTVYQITVTRLDRIKDESVEWARLRDPYSDEVERQMTDEQKQHDPQFGYRRANREMMKETEIYAQKVDRIDMAALVSIVNERNSR